MTASKPKVLLIVFNPSQLMFSYEAVSYLEERLGAEITPDVLVVEDPDKRADTASQYQSLREVIPVGRWKEVTGTRRRLTLVGQTVSFRARARRYEHVITPMLRYFPVRAVLRSRPAAAYDLIPDEGNWNLAFARALSTGQPSETVSKRVLQALPKAMRLFTMYPEIVDELRPTDSVIPNELRWTRGQVPQSVDPAQCVIVGGDFVGPGFMSAEPYIEAVAQLVRRFGSRRTVYLRHRRESLALGEAIAAIPGVEIPARQFPAELEASRYGAGTPNTTLVSFVSTSVRGLRIVAGPDCRLILAECPRALLAPGYRDPYDVMLRSCQADSDESVVVPSPPIATAAI